MLTMRMRVPARATESSPTTYLPLVRFRAPRPLSSWATALLAVLDGFPTGVVANRPL